MHESKQEVIRFPATRVIDVAKALSSDLRLRILEALGEKSMSIGQIAEVLGVAQPTVSINMQILEQAELINAKQNANREKICSARYRSVLLELPAQLGEGLHHTETVEMPIGLFAHCSVQPTCGMATRDGHVIGSPDDPRVFYSAERADAELLWFSGSGYVEYHFANPMPPGVALQELSIRAELCSEAPAFRESWPSDITVTVNDTVAGTWTSPGDFGDRKGKLTPERWQGNTEYGVWTEWRFTKEGSWVNDVKVSDTTIDQLTLNYHQPIRVRFEVREDAVHQNGLNLFGADFGDYAHPIVLAFARDVTLDEEVS